MDDTAVNLEAVSVACAPRNAAVLAGLSGVRRATFRDMRAWTSLHNDGLGRVLEALERHGLIHCELAASPDGEYSFYTMTRRGRKVYELVLDNAARMRSIRPDPVSETFVVEGGALRRMLDKVGIDEFSRVFEKHVVLLTGYDYASANEAARKADDADLEDFLNDEKRIRVPPVYDDIEGSTGMEFHLRRARKMTVEMARVVATAVDQKASIVTDEAKVRRAALAFGIRVAGTADVLAHGKDDNLREVFPIMSASAGDAKLQKPVIGIDAGLSRRLRRRSPPAVRKGEEALDKFVEVANPLTAACASRAILDRLNNISDGDYRAKVSYEVFKTLGRVRERRYQRDIQECLEPIEPLLSSLDHVFARLLEDEKIMSAPVKSSYVLAHTESSIFDSVGEGDPPAQGRFLDATLELDTPAHAGLTTTLLEISGQMRSALDADSSGLHTAESLLAAKRNMERRLDWAVRSIGKKVLCVLKTGPAAAKPAPDAHLMLIGSVDADERLAREINKSAAEFVESRRWKHRQGMSIIVSGSPVGDPDHLLDARYVPDANDLGKIIKLVCAGADILSPEVAARIIGVSTRMGDYYLHAAHLLGLFEKTQDGYRLTNDAKKLGRYSNDDQKGIMSHLVGNLGVVKMLFHDMAAREKRRFTTKDIASFLEKNTTLSESTARRRATTLAAWLKVLDPMLEHRNGRFVMKPGDNHTITTFFTKTPSRGSDPPDNRRRQS